MSLNRFLDECILKVLLSGNHRLCKKVCEMKLNLQEIFQLLYLKLRLLLPKFMALWVFWDSKMHRRGCKLFESRFLWVLHHTCIFLNLNICCESHGQLKTWWWKLNDASKFFFMSQSLSLWAWKFFLKHIIIHRAIEMS